MSESLRCAKTRSNGHNGQLQQQQQQQHHTIPHKFSSIVNKVESLIHKMNHDKHQHQQQLPNHTGKTSHKSEKSKRKSPSSPKKSDCFKCDELASMGKNSQNHLNASLDSLNNLSDNADDEVDDNGSAANNRSPENGSLTNGSIGNFTDSDDAEIAHITGTTAVQVHRRIELDQLTDETIREFNEQCSSLSHDMEFYNSWQNEEEMERPAATAVAEEEGGRENNFPTNNCDDDEYASGIRESDNNNNLKTYCDNPHEDPPGWLEKGDALLREQNNYGTLGRRPLSHIQQIVNDLTQNQENGNRQSPPSLQQQQQQQQCNELTQYALNQLQQNIQNNNSNNNNINNIAGNASVTKTRRSSVASSGSMGRMETIVEEPSENKISVKEILQRFETMNKNETQSKASTLSSGVRAAAQTLNVPIERLESRQSNHREAMQSSANNGHQMAGQGSGGNREAMRNTSSPMMAGSYEETHQHHMHHSGGGGGGRGEQSSRAEQHSRNEMHSRSMMHGMHDALDHHHSPVAGERGHHYNGHNELDDERLIERDHYGGGGGGGGAEHHQQYAKQQSYLHTGRKLSQQQYHQGGGMHPRDTQQTPGHLQPSNLDANYMAEDQHNGGGSTSPSVTRYSLLQFAMQHFRNDQIHDSRSHGRDSSERSSNRSYAELVKWQGVPIRTPLLRLPNDLAPLALECFECILCYCGDIPMDPDLTEVKCVYTVLMHCHKYLALRDEVYCQLMKQTTANRSPCHDSAQRGWRLLSILAAYFGCSDALRPYLLEHLTSAASDRRRSCHGTAAVCLTNLRKTARCGGRKNVPSVEEVTAVSAGRSARRQIYRLPGGAERVVNTRCSTVVADVIAELCALLGIESETEQQEFSLYCIVQGDAFTMPLAADEYILDVTTELLKSGQPFYLIFCRSVWHFPLKRDPAPTPLYVEVLFNQVAPDYLEGLLLELPGNGVPPPEVVRDMARIAALLHRAADLSHVPAMKEIKFLLPKPALGIREIRPAQWVGLVQSAWPQIANLSPGQVKAQFLNVLSAWPLFGSSFFAVKRIWAEEGPHVDDSPMWRDLILALNRRGVLFLDPNTHETMQHWPFMEVISTRKVRSEDGALFLDMKVGNLMQQRVIRVQTEQAHEISRLVRQYITMAQISQRDKRDVVN